MTTLLATVTMDDTVRIWDVESASEFTVIRGHTKPIEHVEFSPDGNRLLTASHDGTARLWDIDGVLTTTLRHLHSPTFAAFSSDGTRIVTLGTDNVAHVWDAASGKKLRRSTIKAVVRCRHATFSPDGAILSLARRAGASSYGTWKTSARSLDSRATHGRGERSVQS